MDMQLYQLAYTAVCTAQIATWLLIIALLAILQALIRPFWIQL